MASIIEMSLDDIIRKKKRENPRIGTSTIKSNMKKNLPPPVKQPVVTDARNQIISKKRNQITDAREKLAQLAQKKDARVKLEELRRKRALTQFQGINLQGRNLPGRNLQRRNSQGKNLQGRNFPNRKLIRNVPVKEFVFEEPSRQVVSMPLSRARMQVRKQMNSAKFLEGRSVSNRTLDRVPKAKPIVRTVENDLEVIDDPMGEEMPAPMPVMANRKTNLQLRIIAHNSDVKSNRNAVYRLGDTEKDVSPPRPQSILKKRPMASLRTEKKVDKAEKSVECRVIVSNLRNTVTGGDIEELFGDVGGMMESRLVRPGTAEVVYKTVEDAQKAVELYHNRQLDGQPMNCLLVTPRSTPSTVASRSGGTPALYSTNSNVEPDLSTFHKVMFSNF